MNCYKTSNNKFFNATSRMADGRNFTDYRPSNEINTHIINSNKILNNNEYRQFLIRSAENIMKKNNEYLFMKNGQFDCAKPYEVGTMLPERTRVVCNKQTCEVKLVNENGFGQGREYVTTSSNKLLTPLKAPQNTYPDNRCAYPFDNFNYYPISEEYNPEKRPAVPGGGDIMPSMN